MLRSVSGPVLAAAVVVVVRVVIAGATSAAEAPGPIAVTNEPIGCNDDTVSFDSGIPQDWSVLDNAGGGVIWSGVAGSGETANYTGASEDAGGSGDAASASSDIFNDTFGQTEFDTELHTPGFSIGNYGAASLNYRANFQHVTFTPIEIERDYLDLDISTDGGSNWVTLISWDEDHGTFRSTPGEAVTVDLTSRIGQSGLVLRWRYYDPHTGDNGWYAQIDEVQLSCWVTAPWGDVDCSGAVSAIDALKVLRYSSGLSVAQTEPCPDMGIGVHTLLTPTRPMGDIDCGNAVNSVDALKILRFGAGLSVGQPPPCPAVGSSLNLYY